MKNKKMKNKIGQIKLSQKLCDVLKETYTVTVAVLGGKTMCLKKSILWQCSSL